MVAFEHCFLQASRSSLPGRAQDINHHWLAATIPAKHLVQLSDSRTPSPFFWLRRLLVTWFDQSRGWQGENQWGLALV